MKYLLHALNWLLMIINSKVPLVILFDNLEFIRSVIKLLQTAPFLFSTLNQACISSSPITILLLEYSQNQNTQVITNSLYMLFVIFFLFVLNKRISLRQIRLIFVLMILVIEFISEVFLK